MTVYIYALLCPVSGKPRYVGKTKRPDTRLYGHIWNAKREVLTHHCARWIKTLLNQGLEPRLEIIRELSPDEDWQKVEMQYIAEYRAAGYDLTNLTAGGDGFHDVAPEVLQRRMASRSKTLALPEMKAKMAQTRKKVWLKSGFREHMKESIKAAWRDPEKRKRLLDGLKFRKSHKPTPEQRQRQSETMSRVCATPEWKAAQSERSKLMHADPACRQRRGAAISKTMERPEVKARLSAAASEVAARPEIKAAKSNAMKAAWNDPAYRDRKLTHLRSAEFRAKQSERMRANQAALTAARWTPERRQQQRERLAARAQQMAASMTPEARAKQGAAMKANWAKRKSQLTAAGAEQCHP